MFDYRLAKPVFFHAFIESSPNDRDDGAILSDLIGGAYEALLIATAQPLADPQDSVSYLKRGSEWQILSGSFEQEYAVYGENRFRVTVSDEDLERSRAVLAMLQWATPEARAGVAMLKRTARPEFSEASAFVHQVGFLEAVLISDLTHGLAEAFGRRGAVFFSETDDELDHYRRLCRGLYRVRSEILHGEDPSQALTWKADPAAALVRCRALAARAVCNLMAFAQDRGATDGSAAALRPNLAEAWKNAELRATIREAWRAVP